MKLKPMADNVLLKQHEAQETTVSGIILATTSKEKPGIYEVHYRVADAFERKGHAILTVIVEE